MPRTLLAASLALTAVAAPHPAHAAPKPAPGPAAADVRSAYDLFAVPRDDTAGKTAGTIFLPKKPAAPRVPAVVAVHDAFPEDAVAAERAAEEAGRNVARRLAPLGWVVFAVDFRRGAYGHEELEDVAGAFDYLKERKEVDPDRIAVIGGGHGGYLAWLAATSPQHARPFAVAANLYGFVDAAEAVAAEWEAETPQVKLTLDKLGDPKANAAAYRDLSPRHHLRRARGALLLAVGTRDPYYAQLKTFHDEQEKAGGGPYAWLELDKAPRGFIDRQEPYTTEAWKAITEYLNDNLKPGGKQ